MRSPLAAIAAIWNIVPAGWKQRSYDSVAMRRETRSSNRSPEMSRDVLTRGLDRLPPRPSGTGDSSAIIASGSGWPTSVWPVVDMMLVSDSTRSGCSMAIVCTIIPPIEAPTTWAAGMSSASSRPTASAASSDSVYGRLDRLPGGERRVHRDHVRRRAVGLRRQPDVAIVEADHPEAPVEQLASRSRCSRASSGRRDPSPAAPAAHRRRRSSRNRSRCR